jgi:phage shock protein PspC (stress-responsive transcriptional regulator)
MKKIININLSGRVIPIEDSAYEKLQAYIESLRRYFVNEEGRDEIINDIESRIAELLNEKIRKGAAAIADNDIDEIASSMGRPEDFDAEAAADIDSPNQTTAGSYTTDDKKTRRRLYRDSGDKFIGGVCSGIANYLNVDPAIVRILFAIIAFGGFGLGVFVYIILWIVLPTQELEEFSGKRLYRNPDDRIIGGVAGGLAAYFGMRASTIRLIFIAPILLSTLISILSGISWSHGFDPFPNIVFGSLSSTFLLAYVILWMVLPEARSPYEKMEMRGEKVDVNTIRQNMKERMKEWSEEVKESAQNISNKAKEFTNTKGKTFATEVGQTAKRTGSGIGHAIGVLFKVFFLFIAGTIAFGLFVALMALIFGGIAWWPVNNFLWTSKWQQLYAWGTLIFFLLVPLVGFFVWLIRRIVGVRSRHSYLGWVFGSLWIIGWVSVILFAASVSRDFRVYDDNTEINIPTAQPAHGKMIVVVSEPQLNYTGSFNWINDDATGFDLSEDSAKLSIVKFRFSKSFDDSLYHVIIRKSSFGRSKSEAQDRAEKIQYHVFSKDSVLDLGNGYAIDRESKFRGQQVEIEIQVPVGKKIRFDASVKRKLNPADIRIRRGWRRGGVNIQIDDDYYTRYLRSDVDYIMGIDGNLKDPDGKNFDERDNNYRFHDNEKIFKKDDDYRYQDNDDSVKPKTGLKKKTDKKNRETGYVGSSAFPVFSLLPSFF